MSGSEALRPLQVKIAQYRRQGWQVVERTDDPPSVVIYREQRDERRGPAGRRGFGASQLTKQSYRKLWIDEKGKIRDDEVDAGQQGERGIASGEPEQLSKLREEKE